MFFVCLNISPSCQTAFFLYIFTIDEQTKRQNYIFRLLWRKFPLTRVPPVIHTETVVVVVEKMASKPLTLAVQSPEGQKRVNLSAASKTDELYAAIVKEFGLQSANDCAVFKDQRKAEPIAASRLKTLTSLGLKHGDRVFVFPKTAAPSTTKVGCQMVNILKFTMILIVSMVVILMLL